VSHVGCRLCSRGCSRVPRAVLQSRVPAEPQGLCAGQGLCRLPGSALSLPGELPRALRGDVWGEGAPRQGRGLLLPQLLPGAGGSQLHCTTRCYQMHFARGGKRLRFSLSYSEGREMDWRHKSKIGCQLRTYLRTS